ncbi:MAG: glycosyltransferase [Acidimicrobiia bacterium]|nr:glycosyltransferase [Acidimicrobiia bacterium]MDH4306858.1 glycosyltransferase [Acidimicrobiia bacterium]MDH5293213.1 glycosyltransferase [Acidimicrobiia bacterium]
MRVLQIHTRYRQRGGEDAVADNERRLLAESGHEVELWEAVNAESALETVRDLALAPWNPRAGRDVADVIARHRPDVVHVHNTWFAASPSVIAAAARVGVPVVMTLHNYRLFCAGGELTRAGSPCEICVGRGPWSAVRYGCFRDSRPASAVSAATISFNRRRGTWRDGVWRFVALTDFARGRFLDAGFEPAQVEVIPNFVGDPGPREAPPSSSDVVLFVGRLTAAKGVATLVEAWRHARPQGLTLRIAGTGPLEQHLRDNPTPGVELLGWLDADAMRAEMLNARALVFPSEWYEGMPMTLLEAFAAGLGVLGSRIGSVEEIVGQLGEGWLTAAGRVEAWSRSLQALTDDQLVDRAGALARTIYVEKHTESAALARLESLYGRAVRREGC